MNAHLETLRRVTRDMAVASDLPILLNSIASALVEHTGAAFARVFLYQTADECHICRLAGLSSGPHAKGEKALHLHANAGPRADLFGPDHLLSMEAPAPPSKVARERKAFLTNDLLLDAERQVHVRPDLLRRYKETGIVAAGARPLEFRGELVGVIGMLSTKPFDPRAFELLGIFTDQAGMAIKSAHLFDELEQYKRRLEVENAYLQDEIRSERGFEEVVGNSAALRNVIRRVKQVAQVDTTVLLTGETGTGKELIARAIHALGARKERAMIKVNCGAIPSGIVESELFGHERGAFTGALQRRIGRFELADKGTLFMDEVGELPLETQVKLLRVLQEQEFERLGGSRPVNVDVRVVAATNRDLDREVAEGRFRSDLYYRLNVFPIRVPPLRERRDDLPSLVRHFLAHFQRKLGKPLRGVTAASMQRIADYDWPGNIRELQNVIERACVLARGPVIEVEPVPASDSAVPDEISVLDDRILTLDEHEQDQIRRALDAAAGKIHGKGGAAEMLGINASTLRSRMEKHGMSKADA